MQNSEVTLSALERSIDMVIPVGDIDKGVEERLKRMSRTVKMAGFRQGKVPLRLVEQTYGPQIRSEVLGEAVERTFNEKVRELNFRVAGYPNIEPKKDAGEGVLGFVATFEVFPEVTVGDLSSREIERPGFSVGEADVDHTIEVLRKQRGVFEPTDRESAEGDRVLVDFTGRKDGEVFEGGQGSDVPVIVGGGQMLPDFDAQLRGVAAGTTRTFDLTFPADYQAKELAGQTVQFEVLVKSVQVQRLPEVDATFAKALGVVDGDVAKMREEIRVNLEREVAKRIRARVRNQALEALADSAEFEVPKALVETESQRMAEDAKKDLAARGMDAKKVPVQPAWFTDQAKKRVKLGLLVSDLVDKHGLRARPEQVRSRVDELAQSYEQPEDVVRWYYAKPENLRDIEDAVTEENVVEWVLSQARTVDKVVTFEELMG